MTRNSRIGWADNTWNPWRGCHPTTNPGCKHCYAVYRVLPKMNHPDNQVIRAADDEFNRPLSWQRRLERTGETETVFNSLTDWFHIYAHPWRDEAWRIIRRTPNLIYILLTQRPQGIRSHLPADWGDGYPNVWLGISASDQHHADKRIPALLEIPAALRVISLEPLTEPVHIAPEWLPGLGWIIAGGMSGPQHKQYPLYPSWVRSLRDQATAARIPFFFKQLGGWPDYRDGDKALLDGQLWQQIPEPTNTPLCQADQPRLF